VAKDKNAKPKARIILDPNPKAEFKPVAGAEHDDWSVRLINLISGALPDQRSAETCLEAINAVCSGMLDMKPADPIEGMLISQIVVANEAAMNLYRLGWANATKYFEAGTKYLQLADKASRTVAMLTERLDQHRNRGQQQITVKHVTVNANQAVVTDQIVSDKGKETIATKLLMARTDKPMQVIESAPKEAVPMEGGGSKPK